MATKQDVTKIKESFDKYVVKPINRFGLGGFVFDVPKEESIRISADITDHYVEDNTAIQDHYALKPLTITLSNYVGELVYSGRDTTQLEEIEGTLQKVGRKLNLISAYVPSIISTAEKIKNSIQNKNIGFEQGVESLANVYGLVKDLNPSATNQQKTYLYLKALMEQKVLFSVETPFEFLENMVIEEINAVRGEETTSISEFTITLKQMRFAKTITNIVTKETQPKTSQQKEEVDTKGKVNGTRRSLIVDALDALKGVYSQ